MSAAFDANALARLFVEARAHRAKLDVLPEGARPHAAEEAYAAQEATLRALGAEIGGWKVGAKSHDGPIQGAPLPADASLRDALAAMTERHTDRLPVADASGRTIGIVMLADLVR